jgi:hypothetical protein
VAAEHKDFGENLVREDTTEEYSFDALAKGLASGTLTRRKALKLMSTTILGAGVLAFFPGTSTAAEDARCPKNGDEGCNVECRGDLARRRDCRCIETVEGRRRCVRPCCRDKDCSSSDDCRSDEVCIRSECCSGERGVCAPKCTASRPNYCDSGATVQQSGGSREWDSSAA